MYPSINCHLSTKNISFHSVVHWNGWVLKEKNVNAAMHSNAITFDGISYWISLGESPPWQNIEQCHCWQSPYSFHWIISRGNMPNEGQWGDLQRRTIRSYSYIILMSRVAIKNHLFMQCRTVGLDLVWGTAEKSIQFNHINTMQSVDVWTVSIVQSTREHGAVQIGNHSFDFNEENPALDWCVPEEWPPWRRNWVHRMVGSTNYVHIIWHFGSGHWIFGGKCRRHHESDPGSVSVHRVFHCDCNLFVAFIQSRQNSEIFPRNWVYSERTWVALRSSSSPVHLFLSIPFIPQDTKWMGTTCMPG